MQTEEQVAVMTPADEAAEEEAFEAGFNATDIEVPVQTDNTTDAEPATEEPVHPDEPIAEPVAPKPLTYEELNAAMAAQKQELQKVHDKVFGKVGELQQKIDALKNKTSGFSQKQRQRMEDEFPELASLLFEGIEEEPEPQPQVKQQSQQPSVTYDPRVEEIQKTFERKLLTRDHRDWEQIVQTPEFATWQSTQLTPEDAAELANSWDADFISGKLNDFKQWTAAQQKQQEKAQKKQERLESAITPKGVPRAGASHNDDDEETAMLEAFGRK